MNPLKFLILALLFYILFRLLVGAGRKKRDSGGRQGQTLPASDTLVEDPVCKVCIPKKQAIELQEKDRTIYFCSAECREKFLANKGAEP